MGGGASISEEEQENNNQDQAKIQQSVEDSIGSGRIKLNHQSNIYQKLEFLQAHYE